jgi:hypothetical protein
MRYAFLSLGQITNSQINKSISELAKLASERSCLPSSVGYFYYYVTTSLRYGYDLLVTKNIEKFRKGEIDEHQFKSFLGSQFCPKVDSEKLENAWNAMCVVDAKAKNTIQNLDALLGEKKDLTIAILGGTDPIHRRYVMEQLPELNRLEQEGRVVTSFSYEEKTLDFSRLAQHAFSKKPEGQEVSEIISLHNRVNRDAFKAYGENIGFEYIPYNPDKSQSTFVELIQSDTDRSLSTNDQISRLSIC